MFYLHYSQFSKITLSLVLCLQSTIKIIPYYFFLQKPTSAEEINDFES